MLLAALLSSIAVLWVAWKLSNPGLPTRARAVWALEVLAGAWVVAACLFLFVSFVSGMLILVVGVVGFITIFRWTWRKVMAK